MNGSFGKDRLNVPLPKSCTCPGIRAGGCHVVGQLQVWKPARFRESIAFSAERASKALGRKIEPAAKFTQRGETGPATRYRS